MISFGEISVETFLSDYWQKKPLLVRQALPGFESPLTPDELAGMAMEPEVESRLILEQGRKGPWELRNGPFTEKDFSRLPEERWTLLVQAVDQWMEEVHALRSEFSFIPFWRFDDIMVSYAPDKGGVGPHFDNYDVFLLQGYGRRRWALGQPCDDNTPIRSDTRLRILLDFEQTEEWVLEPGDMLYIPPGFAHLGVAEGDCMTYSIGFRAPSHEEILAELGAEAGSRRGEDQRFKDAKVDAHAHPGEIPDHALDQIQALFREVAEDRELLRDWLGCRMTSRKYSEELWVPEEGVPEDWAEQVAQRVGIARHPAARFAWSDAEQGILWVDGTSYACRAELARVLASDDALDAISLKAVLGNADELALIGHFLDQGALYLDD